jgi:hypothetical protein
MLNQVGVTLAKIQSSSKFASLAQTRSTNTAGKENAVNTLVPADAHRKTTRALALLRELFLDLGDRRIADAIWGLLSVQGELAADEAAGIV